MEHIDPIQYGKTRNYGDGAITYLSPYISRGVLSTKTVFQHILSLNLPFEQVEKLVQELAWRDYWQQVWLAKGEAINSDLKHHQIDVQNHGIPKAVIEANTGITLIDEAIQQLYKTGYMHNHMRMYVASICCNIGKSHWLAPAKWMFSHLLDGDQASNQLSWQWVAGAFSSKKYVANQDNINKFFNGKQKNTFLDVGYDQLSSLNTPQHLKAIDVFEYQTKLPEIPIPKLDLNKTTLIYNYYNLDPSWRQNEDVQNVLLLEPSFFSKNPVTQKCIEFVLQLSQNIQDCKIFIGEFSELIEHIDTSKMIYREHPTNLHYMGTEDSRDWMFSVGGYYPSFFAFWKKCKKELGR